METAPEQIQIKFAPLSLIYIPKKDILKSLETVNYLGNSKLIAGDPLAEPLELASPKSVDFILDYIEEQSETNSEVSSRSSYSTNLKSAQVLHRTSSLKGSPRNRSQTLQSRSPKLSVPSSRISSFSDPPGRSRSNSQLHISTFDDGKSFLNLPSLEPLSLSEDFSKSPRE